MRVFLLFGLLTLSSVSSWGQIQDPIKWTFDWKQTGDQEFELVFKATIESGWYTYSQFLESDEGPVATTFNFDPGDHFGLIGKAEEAGTIKKAFDNTFEMELTKIMDQAIFTQKVKVNDPTVPITGMINFMVCNEEMCLPPTDEPFEFKVAAAETDNPTPKGIESAPSSIESAPGLSESNPTIGGSMRDPIKWSASIKPLEDQLYLLEWTAEIDQPWVLYSQFIDLEDGVGPIPTSFNFDPSDGFELIGKTDEGGGKKKTGMDPYFGIELAKFIEGPAVFTQKVKVSDPSLPITGFLEYMTCNDEECLPPTTESFSFDLARGTARVGDSEGVSSVSSLTTDASGLLFADLNKPALDQPLAECGTAATAIEQASYGRIFFLGFLGGLIALLTPCVFPMIPLTVSFFTKSSTNRTKGVRNAMLYGFFILLVYLLLSLPFHLLDSVNPDILNDISTNVWLNLFFFVIFLFFAFSFFGYYELTLPSSWTNRSSTAEGIGGVIGVFFMAVTLALVSFSCTGPILGSLLVGALSADGGAMQLTAGMGGFGLALALPFALFAAFPGFMSSLPKSGGWLNAVKVVLGFLELALAFKFLSNADMVQHWGLLKIEPFLAIWILIFTGMGLYLLGRIRFPHDSSLRKLSIGRIALGVVTFSFVAYLASGFMVDRQMNSYRPLKLLSGLAPPVCYSFLKPCDCPQNLNCFKDLEEGLAYAKENNKPVLLDFTGYACVNCRKMEEHVWPEKEVYDILKDDFVLISLYVDDKKALPDSEQVTVATYRGNRTLYTYGNKWSHFQAEYFKRNTQPYYALVTPELQLLNTPVGYTPDKYEYTSFLQCGLDAYNKLAEK